MNFTKRLLAVVLAFLMVFALVACTGDSGTSNSENPGGNSGGNNGGNSDYVSGSDTSAGGDSNVGGGDIFVLPDRPLDEMQEKNYIIIQHQEPQNPFGYLQDSVLGLQAADRLAEVQELYGCTLEFSQVPYANEFATQLQALAYSEHGGDLVFSTNNAQLRKALGTGGDESLCYDLLKFDHIINFWDMNKWGNITARECMMAGGIFYGVSPALWLDYTPLPYYTVVYNKDIITSAGATDPQESWEKNEWDNYTMVEVIKSTTNEADGIWGMTATMMHMVRATFLSNGLDLINIDNIGSDGTVTWSSNLSSGETLAAFTWLKNTLTANKKCFNKGGGDWDTWTSHTPFNEGLCAMAVVAPSTLTDIIVVEGPTNFGVTTWAGPEANTLTGYYEMVRTIAIPTFAQNADHSAFLMYDLFEGLGEIETYEDVLNYYSKTYFNSEVDLTCYVREGASLQYSYWPNGCDGVWNSLASGLMTASSMAQLIEKYVHLNDTELETHMVPNKVALEKWRQAGKFD